MVFIRFFMIKPCLYYFQAKKIELVIAPPMLLPWMIDSVVSGPDLWQNIYKYRGIYRIFSAKKFIPAVARLSMAGVNGSINRRREKPVILLYSVNSTHSPCRTVIWSGHDVSLYIQCIDIASPTQIEKKSYTFQMKWENSEQTTQTEIVVSVALCNRNYKGSKQGMRSKET